MDNERLLAFQKAPQEGIYRCMSCGFQIELKQGQLVPPCPKCSFREFAQSAGIKC